MNIEYRLRALLNNSENINHRTYTIYDLLIKGQNIERNEIRKRVGEIEFDWPKLRGYIIDGLKGEFIPQEQHHGEDPSLTSTRSWLLCILGRICDGDPNSMNLLESHLCPDYETEVWCRYWTLEGLIVGNPENLPAILNKVQEQEKELLVSQLANAALAKAGNKELVNKIVKDLESEDTEKLWATLRALRIIPLTATVQHLCKIVESKDYNDMAYDAIIALGRIPKHTNAASKAIQTLTNFIYWKGKSPKRDAMRAKALHALGELEDPSVGAVLISQLIDENPAIVREAAWALENTLGINTSVLRILEKAHVADHKVIQDYANALRWMDREKVVNELENFMVAGPVNFQDTARYLLGEIGGLVAYQKLQARTNAIEQYMTIMENAEGKISNLFDKTVSEARRGFGVTLGMDLMVFIVGILLIIFSALIIILQGDNLNNWVGIGITSGTGVLGVLYGTLISKPRKQVEFAVDHLMHLQIIFLAYIRQLHQVDQAYTRRLIEDREFLQTDLEKFSNLISATMKNAVTEMSKNNSMTMNG